MNETNHTTPDVPWSPSAPRVQEPDTSMMSGSHQALPATADLVTDSVRGAHDTVDRLAESAAPVVRQIGESVSSAAQTLHAKTDQLRETSDEWVESVRHTVRDNPLATLAAALALGVVIARLTR